MIKNDVVELVYQEIEDGLGIVKVLTLCRWIEDSKLRAAKMGRAWMVMGDDLLDAIRDWKPRRQGQNN